MNRIGFATAEHLRRDDDNLWFAKIQRDIIDRGVFTSVPDLARKLRRYIRAYEKQARPFRLNLHPSTTPHSH